MLKYDLGQGGLRDWLVAETDFDRDHQGKCEAVFCQGNGYLGQRAALEEPYSGQTRDLLVNGTFDRFDEEEVCELPNLPDVTRQKMKLNGIPFTMDRGTLRDYLRVLNLRTGEVVRTLEWTDPEGRRYGMRFERFVSLSRKHVLGFRTRITPLDEDCALTLESGIDGQVTCTGTQHFHEGDKRVIGGDILRMVSETVQSGVSCCIHETFSWTLDGGPAEPKTLPVIDRRYLGIRAKLTVSRGRALEITRLVCVHTSRDPEFQELPSPAGAAEEEGLREIRGAAAAGYDALAEESRAAWAAYWEKADVLIRSRKDTDQLLIRFALYHLNIMANRKDSRMGIGAKGLTGEGYKGHSFWDTEIFILPYFILTEPEAARTLLEYRYRGLYGARKKALENGFEGAMYPWEAAWIDDGEVTPLWGAADIVTGKPIPILTGLIEQHITADVAFAVQLYYAVTGDLDFMDRYGWEILIETARFWASRMTWDAERQAYVILDVIGPDEYKDHVDNNAYTNYMAVNNMKLGLRAMDRLDARRDETRERLNAQLDFDALRKKIQPVLEKAYLPAPDAEGIVPQFDGYFSLKSVDLTPYKSAGQVGTIYEDYNQDQITELQVHKQADTLALMLLLDDLFPHEIKVKNYYYYEARTLHDSSLSRSTHCVLAADLGETETAYRFFRGCGGTDLGPNMKTSDAGIHAAAMGGIWQCAVYGFGGVRVVGEELHVRPRLPEEWEELSFRIVWRGQPLRITVLPDRMTAENLGTEAVLLTTEEGEIRLEAGETGTVPLKRT